MKDSRCSIPFHQKDSRAGFDRISRDARPLRLMVALFVIAFFSSYSAAWAQKDAGAIAGTVRDASGAVVAAAKVKVTGCGPRHRRGYRH